MLNQTASRTMFIITFLLATLCLNSKPYEKYEDMLTDFKNLSIDESKVFAVSKFSITRNPSQINIDTGTIYFCKPINSRYRFLMFNGKAEFKFTPKEMFEINQLRRLMKNDSIDIKIKRMLVFYSDTLGDVIESNCKNVPYKFDPQFKSSELIKDFLEYEFNSERGKNNNVISSAILNDSYDATYYVFLQLENNKDLFFQINPSSTEEIEFIRGDWDAFHSFNEIICKYHLINETDNKIENYNNSDSTTIKKYIINGSLDNEYYFKSKTKMELNSLDTSNKWILFRLLGNLKIKKALINDSINLKYYQLAANADLWIRIPDNLIFHNPIIMEFEYEGDVYFDHGNWFNSILWYPSLGDKRKKAIFDLTFTTPKKYEFATVGKLISEEVVDSNITTHWITSNPIRNASFSIDKYKKKELKTKDSVNLMLLYKTEEQLYYIENDLKSSIEKFTDLFGPIKLDNLIVSEEFGYQYEAFSGLIHLSHNAFNNLNNGGLYEIICSHEVAHQWWGIGVDFESYHDQWLSEGLAQYSALIYLQSKFKNKLFFEYINIYKKGIIDVRSYFLGKPIPAGPISLGFRNNTTKTQGDFSLVVYQKGAWVFHMLRNLLLDLQTMKEDKFFNMMKEFYQENAGKTVNTGIFQKKVESALNMDMDWFFNQWIDGYHIPKYKFAYTTEKTESGNYKVSCRVEQSEVNSDFQMYVPIKIDFGDKRVYRLRKLITGKMTEFDLPIFADKPIDVIFNDLESVLCEVDYVKW